MISDKNEIGAVFTPINWAKWLIKENGILEKWLNGATVLDPTCGDGAFLFALIELGLESGLQLKNLPIQNLFGTERESKYLDKFSNDFKNKYNLSFPQENLLNCDIILDTPNIKADILIGNPPWTNFCDLPEVYKQKLKNIFIEYDLVESFKNLLLGYSRIDIAALIICKTIADNLKNNGEAHFFVPLSLFLNQGAHDGFRKFKTKNIPFALIKFYDFNNLNIFEKILTRYGTAHFIKGEKIKYPVVCYRLQENKWEKNYALPLYKENNPFSIFNKKEEIEKSEKFSKIIISDKQKPRQGANTCGANDFFIFQNVETINENYVQAESKIFGVIKIPHKFIFPLIDKKNFSEKIPTPYKYILLLYDENTGKPLSEKDIKKYDELWDYLKNCENNLKIRKGVLINALIKRNLWWGMLGVGKYSFAPYKVAWQAYGDKKFSPKIFSSYKGRAWQGNQAMHAYIPCRTEEDAVRIFNELSKQEVNIYLDSFAMSGTKSFAQPGRISKLFFMKK